MDRVNIKCDKCETIREISKNYFNKLVKRSNGGEIKNICRCCSSKINLSKINLYL